MRERIEQAPVRDRQAILGYVSQDKFTWRASVTTSPLAIGDMLRQPTGNRVDEYTHAHMFMTSITVDFLLIARKNCALVDDLILPLRLVYETSSWFSSSGMTPYVYVTLQPHSLHSSHSPP